MNRHNRTLLSLAATLTVVTIPVGVAAEEDSLLTDEVLELIRPENSTRTGLGFIDGDPVRYGQFIGVDESGGVPMVDVELVERDEESGTWLRLDVNNLGFEHREARVEYERQGDWKYYLDYSRIPRRTPLTFTTGLTGAGSDTQQVNGTARRAIELDTVRDALTLGFQKQHADKWETQVRFKHETKEGARPFGKQGFNFVAEPIDSVIKEFEANLGYTGTRLQLLGGYYGSWYGNDHKALTVDGAEIDSFTAGADPNQISLPLDNEAHQVYLSGGYGLTPTTRATFKVSQSQATQDDEFLPLEAGTALAAQDSLDGRVDTTLVQMGVTSRPRDKLSLLANVRYEDRDDKTPVHQFLTPGAAFPHALNTPYSRTATNGRAEATYRLTREYSVTAGVDHERQERDVPRSIAFTDPADPAQARQVSFRADTEETGYRLEVRRTLADRVNGSLAYSTSRRDGSDFLPADDSVSPDFVAPINWADRERDKWRLTVDWIPIDPVSVQLVAERADDRYSGLPLGPRSGDASLLSLDVSYALSDVWQLTGWVSSDETKMEQATCGGIAGGVSPQCTDAVNWMQWAANLHTRGDAIGLGVRGSPTDEIKLGADLQYAHERSEYGFDVLAAAGSAALPDGLPPDIFYRTATLGLFLEYASTERSGWRLDYNYQHVATDDWTWDLVGGSGNSLYAGGTTVKLDKDAKAQFIAVSYYLRWR